MMANTYAYVNATGYYNSSMSGTWRLMGETGYYNGYLALSRMDQYTSVFVRIY